MSQAENPLDAFERDFRAGIGKEYNLDGERIVREATRDTILNFAEAVGDANPLWTDEDYAARSRFGGLTAPPTFLYAVTHGSTPANGRPGAPPAADLALLYAGAELEFNTPVRRGDSFTVSGKSTAVERKKSKALGALLFTTGEASYRNQDGDLVGMLRTTICRYLPPQRHAVKIDRRPRPETAAKSPDLLAYDRVRRGAEPRYWEDVEIGEDMPVMEKGLLTMMEIVRFSMLAPPVPRRIEQRRPWTEIGFAREKQQRRAGLEDASDYGPQRVCWLGQFATDWMGDEGALKKLAVKIRHPNIIGDVNTVRGKVKGKRIAHGEHLATCEIAVVNQSGLVTAPGTAVIALPSRG
jgi:acyl dehydratase